MEKFSNVNELVNTLKPVNPIYCIRPDTIKNSIKVFKDKFPGKILYAVKTNPNEYVLKNIIKNGVDRFDVASINEVKLIRKLSPKSKLYFMHPIKSREDIASAYFDYNKEYISFPLTDSIETLYLSVESQAAHTGAPLLNVSASITWEEQ